MSFRVQRITIFPLAVPMKRKVEHAAHARTTADPIVVEATLADGTVGYGETLARPYVTGETRETCAAAIRNLFAPIVADWNPENFDAAVHLLEALPLHDDAGAARNASRAGIELALLDAYSRAFDAPIASALAALKFPNVGSPGSIRTARCTGVLASQDIDKVERTLRLMRCGGFRHFKLKVAMPHDDERLRRVAARLGRGLTGGRSTLRIDANGAWSTDEAIERLNAWADVPILCVEQPIEKGREADLPRVKAQTPFPIEHDESLTSLADAQALHAAGVADVFNIRISKCGGWLASLRIAQFAREIGAKVFLGCLVGETSILSAAQRRFLEVVPGIDHVEGNFGRFLLRDDVVPKPLQFGYGGRLATLPGPGWGIAVERPRVEQFAEDVITIEL